MSKVKDGGAAFPLEYSTFEYQGDPAYTQKTRIYNKRSGMTLRQYYAAKAMQGAIAHYGFTEHDYRVAKMAFALADAMIAFEEAEQSPTHKPEKSKE